MTTKKTDGLTLAQQTKLAEKVTKLEASMKDANRAIKLVRSDANKAIKSAQSDANKAVKSLRRDLQSAKDAINRQRATVGRIVEHMNRATNSRHDDFNELREEIEFMKENLM